MSDVVEQNRWIEFHRELCSRVLFTPSCVMYFTHLANNRIHKSLHSAASDLASCLKYGKYYFLDLDKPHETPFAPPTNSYDPEEIISKIKTPRSSRIPVTKDDAIRKVISCAENFNTKMGSLQSVSFGVQSLFKYPEECHTALLEYSRVRYDPTKPREALGRALKCRAAKERVFASQKGHGATFTIQDKEISCFMKGDAISPKLLGIEVGDLVNDDYSFEVTNISTTSFTIKNSGLSSVSSILSPLVEAELVASTLRSFVSSYVPIKITEINNASDFKEILQQILDRVRDIDSSLTPSLYSNLGLTLKANSKSILPTMRPRIPKFSRSQRNFAVKTLELAKSRGFDVVEFMLKNYRTRDCLITTNQRSLHSLALSVGTALSIFVVETRRTL